MNLLTVDELSIRIGGVSAVTDVSFEMQRGQRLGLVGESGAGKSLTALAILGLLPDGTRATGSVRYEDQEILNLDEKKLVEFRGDRIATIFQNPMTALNPVVRIGNQVAEMITLHRRTTKSAARQEAVQLLDRVGLPDPGAKARSYPHELSGGQRQRVMIATAMACSPSLLIADEPTTALDASVQAEILQLMDNLVTEQGSSLLLITHDIPVIDSMCDEVLVMYGGRIVEHGSARHVFSKPHHPYTAGLLQSQPNPSGRRSDHDRLTVIEGVVPPLGQFPSGCGFRDRCPRAQQDCEENPPLSVQPWKYNCWHPMISQTQ